MLLCTAPLRAGGETPAQLDFRKEVHPILESLCYDCHADGARKGEIAFDEYASDEARLADREQWWKVLKNVRAGLMPPPRKTQPTSEQKQFLSQWIKSAVFRLDAERPDPGRVVPRRLNRVEYRNTIRDLMGVEFNTETEFPPDDTGHGFDNIGDVLTLPPMLLEKYLIAAQSIVQQAVPTVAAVVPETTIPGTRFQKGDQPAEPGNGPRDLSFYEAASISAGHQAPQAGKYRLVLDFSMSEKHVEGVFDYNKGRVIFRVDGKELLNREMAWQGSKPQQIEFDQEWAAGARELSFSVEPTTPGEKQTRSLMVRLGGVKIVGPLDGQRVRPPSYERFFPGTLPEDSVERRAYAAGLLRAFATKAFRRPVEDALVERLTKLAEDIFAQPGKTFEAGMAQAMTAVLASPRFLFREETTEPTSNPAEHPLLDEFSLASRLSYFLWATMPDAELMRLAGEHKLRANLAAQVQRMLADPKSGQFVRNFTGQWLRARDIQGVNINARAVLAAEGPVDPEAERRRQRFRELRNKPDDQLTPEELKEMAAMRAEFSRQFGRAPRVELTGDLRRAMREETEQTFNYIIRNDRDLLELIDSDYTFLNEKLAKFYGIEGVSGNETRRVALPAGSARGGVLTHGSVLAVTSNPTRTSPVKRGLFILDNLLGTPPPPPPPNIPALEDSFGSRRRTVPTLRETLAQHREQPLCSSCHDRMDPLGLALENFNAMGMWRNEERGKPVDATGQLITGETFQDIRDLKHLLVTKHQADFYRNVTEKLMTYALGRGTEFFDVGTVDTIVDRLLAENGRASLVLTGIIDSAAFQRTRRPAEEKTAAVDDPKH